MLCFVSSCLPNADFDAEYQLVPQAGKREAVREAVRKVNAKFMKDLNNLDVILLKKKVR